MNDISLEYDAERKASWPCTLIDRPAFTQPLARPSAGLCCPHCGSIIYSRRHKLCGVCAQELPADLLFPKEEAQRLEGVLRHEQVRHRTWMTKAFNQALAPSFLPNR